MATTSCGFAPLLSPCLREFSLGALAPPSEAERPIDGYRGGT